MGPQREAVHAMIERQFGEVVVTVEQEVRAIGIDRVKARLLGVKSGSPALWVCRKYRNRRAELIEMTLSIHPADRFSHSTVLRREWRV